jgi:hypothetical protein
LLCRDSGVVGQHLSFDFFVHSCARVECLSCCQPEPYRNGGEDYVVPDRLDPNASELAQVTQAGGAYNERCHHQGNDNHYQEIDKSVADGLDQEGNVTQEWA